MKMGGAGTGWGLRRLLEPGLVGVCEGTPTGPRSMGLSYGLPPAAVMRGDRPRPGANDTHWRGFRCDWRLRNV